MVLEKVLLVFSFVSILVSFGFSAVLVKRYIDAKKSGNKGNDIDTIVTFNSIGTFGLMFASAALLTTMINGTNKLVDYSNMLTFSFSFGLSLSVAEKVFQKQKKFKSLNYLIPLIAVALGV